MATRNSVSPLSARLRNRWFGLALGFLLLWASFAVIPVFRLPSGDLLWFPPTGVAIAMALWFGPIGVLLTGLGSLPGAVFDGSAQGMLLGGVNVVEALLAWVLYRRWLQGSRSLGRWRDGVAFLLTVPLLACGTAAMLEAGIQRWAGLLPVAELSNGILHGWLSRSLGAMAIAPLLLLGLTPSLMRWEWLQPERSEGRSLPPQPSPASRWDVLFILGAVIGLRVLPLLVPSIGLGASLPVSLLGVIPVLWATVQLGLRGEWRSPVSAWCWGLGSTGCRSCPWSWQRCRGTPACSVPTISMACFTPSWPC